jgi:hypothetical protein
VFGSITFNPSGDNIGAFGSMSEALVGIVPIAFASGVASANGCSGTLFDFKRL